MEATGKLNKEDMGAVPDVYNYNQEPNDQCAAAEVNAQKAVVEKATPTWEKFRKERDVHRCTTSASGRRKQAPGTSRSCASTTQYEPTIKEPAAELAMKEKMLVRIERDRSFRQARGDRGGAGEGPRRRRRTRPEGCRGKGGGGREGQGGGAGGDGRRQVRGRRPPMIGEAGARKRARARRARRSRRAFPAGVGRRARGGRA